MGKISVIAKGARSRRSKVSAATQLLTYSEMVLSESHGWQYLPDLNGVTLTEEDAESCDDEIVAVSEETRKEEKRSFWSRVKQGLSKTKNALLWISFPLRS